MCSEMMNKRTKALFYDIDGTLLSEKTRRVPESAVQALKEARRQGHLVFINTGRVYAWAILRTWWRRMVICAAAGPIYLQRAG